MATGCGLVGCSPMSLDIFLTNHGVTLVKHTVLQQSINGRWGEHADCSRDTMDGYMYVCLSFILWFNVSF